MVDTAFLVLGESLVDLIGEAGTWRFEAAVGGSPLNVAIGLAAAGQPVRLATEVGDDRFGGLVREHLARHDVDLTDLVTARAPTNLAFAHLDPGGIAGYDFRFGWTWSGPVPLERTSCLHVGSLAAVTAPGASAVLDTVRAARRRGITVSYDPNPRPALLGDRAEVVRQVEELVSLADLVKVSADDLAWLHPGSPDLVVARHWATLGPWLVVVTRSGAGAVAIHHGHLIECPAPRVEVVDTVGAGDAFTAALLSSLAQGGYLTSRDGHAARDRAGVSAALQYATARATISCTHRGATRP